MTTTMTEIEWAQRIVKDISFWRPARPAIIELGAHHGNDTVVLYDACGVSPHYLAVEADPRNIPLLVNRVGNRNARVAHYAVAGHCGTVDLNLSSGPNATGSSSIRRPKEHLRSFPETIFAEVVVVPALTLDALASVYQMYSAIDLIWCDIQGAERDMIAGGQETLKRTSYLLCECDAVEMYEGQITRDGFLDLLPGWELIGEWPENANLLLQNRAKA